MESNLLQATLINIMLASIVLSVSIKIEFKELVESAKDLKAIFIGVLTQVFLLPLLTFIVANAFSLSGELAMGLFIVGACSGGSLSNIFTDISKGDIKYSVILTSFSSILGPLTIPSNILFWSSLYPPTKSLLSELELNVFDMYLNIFLILGVPLTLGVYFRTFHKSIALKAQKYIRYFAIISMCIIIIGMSAKYYKEAIPSIQTVLPITFSHNIFAMLLGLVMGCFLTKKKQKTLVFEVGIQNSGLGAALVFQFFPSLRVALIVCFWWSIVHCLNSIIFIGLMRKIPYFQNNVKCH